MTGFYISIVAILFLFAFAGYKAGFIKTIITLLQITAAIFAAYFLYPSAANLTKKYFALQDPVLLPVTFCIIFFISFVMLLLLFIPFKKSVYPYHQHRVNKITGILPGLCIGFMVTAFLTGCCLPQINLPDTLQNEIAQSDLSITCKPAGNWMQNKIDKIINPPVAGITAAANENSFSEEAVNLSFVTTIYSFRPDMEMELLQLINRERENNGLKALAPDPELCIVAREHSADMLKRGYFSHITPDSVNPFQRMRKANIHYLAAGENLALSKSLLLAHLGLMQSPGHRANILNIKYKKVGIGIADAGSYGLMISQEFRD